MQLWLSLRDSVGDGVTPPDVCPRAGCGGRRLRLRQAVAKSVRGSVNHRLTGGKADKAGAVGVRGADGARRTVIAHRFQCLDCGRTFRVYPDGVNRGRVATGVKRFAAALHVLGLGFRDVSSALAVWGAPLGKSQVHGAVHGIAGEDRGRWIARSRQVRGFGEGEVRVAPPLFARVGLNAPADGAFAAGWIEINERRLPLRRVVDAQGRPALVIDDVDYLTRVDVARWGREAAAGLGVEIAIVNDEMVGWAVERRSRCSAVDEWVEEGAGEDGGGLSSGPGNDGDSDDLDLAGDNTGSGSSGEGGGDDAGRGDASDGGCLLPSPTSAGPPDSNTAPQPLVHASNRGPGSDRWRGRRRSKGAVPRVRGCWVVGVRAGALSAMDGLWAGCDCRVLTRDSSMDAGLGAVA